MLSFGAALEWFVAFWRMFVEGPQRFSSFYPLYERCAKGSDYGHHTAFRGAL